MFQSLSTAFPISTHRFSQTPMLSDTCRLLNECAEYVYLHACCPLCRKHGRDGNVVDACSNNCSPHSIYSDIGLAKHRCYPIHAG
jgi:hypothetical protein